MIVFSREVEVITGSQRFEEGSPFTRPSVDRDGKERLATRAEVLSEVGKGVTVNCDLILQEQPSGIAAVIIHVPAGEFVPEVGKTYRLVIEELE